MNTVVIEDGAIATVDTYGTEYERGYLVVTDGVIGAVGAGSAPQQYADARRISARGCLVTPGLVNTHHHLYQWATRGYAQDATLFGWLTELYPVWTGLNEEIEHAAASAGLAWLARTGATTVADHHYVYPADGGDVFAALVAASDRIGLRLHGIRGSMDRGRSQGGLPPDDVVETLDDAVTKTAEAIDRFHDPAPNARVRVAVGPCSPFSVSSQLMTSAADLARSAGVRLHTHLAETVDEEQHCLAQFGCTPVEYAESLGWLGSDVWLAHAVHLSDTAIKRLGQTTTGVAHCPTSNGRLGAGLAPVRGLLDAGAPVGLGVDGAASNESCGLVEELHQALLVARLRGGPTALSAREALALGTIGGARCLGRESEIGSLEPGKLADIAVWQLDGLGHAGIADPVAALVLGPQPQVKLLLVGGRQVVVDGELQTANVDDVATELRQASDTLRRRAKDL